jgi:hypothetical protein
MGRIALLVAAFMALASCKGMPDVPMTDIAFGADNASAMLIHHRDSWDPIYQPIDLATGRTLPGGGLNTAVFTGLLQINSNRVTPALKQELGIEDIGFGSFKGGYNGYLMPPGDYALVGIAQPNTNGYGSWVDIRCFGDKAPVFHLSPGTVNMLESADRKNTRVEQGAAYDKALAEKDTKLGRFLVAGYPNITANVVLAPVVGKVQFSVGDTAQSHFNPCPVGDVFRPAP